MRRVEVVLRTTELQEAEKMAYQGSLLPLTPDEVDIMHLHQLSFCEFWKLRVRLPDTALQEDS
jgi:hypothetical protein